MIFNFVFVEFVIAMLICVNHCYLEIHMLMCVMFWFLFSLWKLWDCNAECDLVFLICRKANEHWLCCSFCSMIIIYIYCVICGFEFVVGLSLHKSMYLLCLHAILSYNLNIYVLVYIFVMHFIWFGVLCILLFRLRFILSFWSHGLWW